MKTPLGILEDTLRRAVSLEADELTFFSGVGAVITTAAGQRPLPMAEQLSAQRVRDLHEACLAVAGRDHLKWLRYARYPVSFPNIGEFWCEYVERRGTSNLRLQRDPFAAQMVETTRVPKLPPPPARLSVPRPEPRFVEEVGALVHPGSRDDKPRGSALNWQIR